MNVSDFRSWLVRASLRRRAAEMRECERLARLAYPHGGRLRDVAHELADIYREAAELFEKKLAALDKGETPHDRSPEATDDPQSDR